MPRRFNYTGRKRIRRADANIHLTGEGDALIFNADLKLADYELDATASVCVEAYRSRTASYRRFEFGRVGALVKPEDRSLAEFNDPSNILFRVKVTVDRDGLGKLLADADGISPRQTEDDDDTARPLLTVDSYDLEGETWRVDFEPNGPVLAIDHKIPQKRDYALDPVFRAHAAPVILREILVRILLIEEDDRDGEPERWENRWLKFATHFAGRTYPKVDEASNDDERLTWVNDAVKCFARSGKFLDALLTSEDRP